MNTSYRFLRSLSVLVATAAACATTLHGASARADAPLPLKPENGPSSPTHLKNLNKIVFSKSLSALDPGREQPAQFATTFKLSDPIFFRVYLDHSMGNRARQEGTECAAGGSVHEDYLFKADTGDSIVSKARVNDELFYKWTTWRDGAPLTVMKDNEDSMSKDFLSLVRSLPPGAHKISMTLSARCSTSVDRTFESKPLASGELTLVIDAATQAAVTAPKTKMPKPGKNDPAFSALATSLANKEWAGSRKALKTVIKDNDWVIERNELTGIVISRSLDTVVAYKKGEACFLYGVRFRQDAQQKRGSFGQAYFASEEMGDGEPIACANVK